MSKAPTAFKLSDTHANDSNFLKPDWILGVPFTCIKAEMVPSNFNKSEEQAVLTIVFHESDDTTEYALSNGGKQFVAQVGRIKEHNQFPFIACVERNERGKAGPNGVYPLMLAELRSDRGEVDMPWLGTPDTTE